MPRFYQDFKEIRHFFQNFFRLFYPFRYLKVLLRDSFGWFSHRHEKLRRLKQPFLRFFKPLSHFFDPFYRMVYAVFQKFWLPPPLFRDPFPSFRLTFRKFWAVSGQDARPSTTFLAYSASGLAFLSSGCILIPTWSGEHFRSATIRNMLEGSSPQVWGIQEIIR